jgi:hypothetical protein
MSTEAVTPTARNVPTRERHNSSDSDSDEYLKDVAVFVKGVTHDVVPGKLEEELHWSDIGEYQSFQR